jgi:hypothetical protein
LSQGDEAPLRGRGGSRAVIYSVAFALAVAFAVLPFQTREPLADGTFYVSTLHSLYADGDVDLSNEAEHYLWLRFYSRAAVPLPGGLRNPFPIGPPLMWSPFYVAFDLASRAVGAEGASPQTGPRTAPIYFATTFWVAVGLCLLASTLIRLGVERAEAVVVCAAIFGLSPLPAYVTYSPDFSHGCAFAAVCLFLYTCVVLRQEATAEDTRWLLCGLSLGLVFLVRWQDAMLGVLPIALLWFWRDPSGAPLPLARRARGAVYIGVGAAIGTLPQLFYWKALYGTWLLVPGSPEHTGKVATIFSLGNAEPLAFFFSTWNGAFLCHPALALCMLSLALHRRSPFSSLPGLWAGATFGVALLAASSLTYTDWWAGGSFGQRRFISTLPFLALGLSALWRSAAVWHPRARAALATLLLVLGAWNALSLFRLHEGSIPYNPEHRLWYPERTIYGYYDYGRRMRHILFGAPEATPR